MSAPKWIDKLRGFLLREETPAGTPAETNPAESAQPNAGPAAPAPQEPVAKAPVRPVPPRPAPGPVIPTLDSRKLADMALKQLGASGNAFLQQAQKSGKKLTPGLEHDITLLLFGYTLSAVALKAQHGDAAAEALRTLRGNMKTALLAVLRKYYHKANMAEDKLGANMVTQVDEILAAADTTNAAIGGQLGSSQAFEPLFKRIVPALGEGASEADVQTHFGQMIRDQYARVSQALANAPKD